MNSVALLLKYFPALSDYQISQFEALEPLYRDWNSKINVISRKDIDNLYTNHILHSLAIAKVCNFGANEQILDVGTGGGLPGIPLAILFPDTSFTLVDSIGKKINVVNEVSKAIALKNVTAHHARAEDIKKDFHFVVSRAVTRLSVFYPWIKNKISKEQLNQTKNGILYLKGGDLTEEIQELGLPTNVIPIKNFFEEEFFDTKFVLHITQN